MTADPQNTNILRHVRTDDHIDLNPNGTYFCNACRMLIILFEDDEPVHDCTNTYPWEEDNHDN